MDLLPKKLEAYPVKPYFSEQQELNDRLSEILPPYISETPLTTRGKRLFRIFARITLIICLLFFDTVWIFSASRGEGERYVLVLPYKKSQHCPHPDAREESAGHRNLWCSGNTHSLR